MIRSGLAQFETEKRPQRQRVGCPPRNPALGIDPFKVPDQQRTKVNSGREARTPDLSVETLAGRFGKGIKSALVQQPVQTLIEWMADRCRQPRCFDPDWLLLFVCSSLAQRHESILKRFAFSSQAKNGIAPRTAREGNSLGCDEPVVVSDLELTCQR